MSAMPEGGPAEPAPSAASSAAAPAPTAGQSCACPLAQVPANVWKDLLRRPFRKRHPVIFWGLILLLLAGVGVFGAALGSNGLMGGQRIALVSVSGPIMDPEPALEWIRKVERDPMIAGVLLRVDSPGGAQRHRRKSIVPCVSWPAKSPWLSAWVLWLLRAG